MSENVAVWNISLDCECPNCKEDVDLLDCDDFWHGVKFEAGEWGTKNTRDVEVYCPKCGYEFKVDFEY